MFETRKDDWNYEQEGRGFIETEGTYTIDDVREILGVSKSTVYGIVRANLFSSICRDGKYEIPKQDFIRWLELLQAET